MKKIVWILTAILWLTGIPVARADGGEGCYTVLDQQGETLFTFAGEMETGDEYVSAENGLYVIVSVDEEKQTAQAQWQGQQEMPNVDWLETATAVAVSATEGGEERLIAMYCTHSDESYEPTDGVSSDDAGEGGIYDVSGALAEALEGQGITVLRETTSHVPHDAGAYRRSRQTAVELLKQGPDVLLDIHRDGIPDPSEYETSVEGQDVSRVRLLVGRSNQNADANKAFALELKAVADATYPGLIKDIFIGKGTYNQDLMANSVLLEFGTYTNDKDLAVASTDMMADVIATTVYGGVSGPAGGGEETQETAEKGAWSGAIWVLIAAAVAIAAYALLQTGGGRAAWDRVKRSTGELTAGWLGGKKKQ